MRPDFSSAASRASAAGPASTATGSRLGRLAAEGDPERHGEEDREDEDPEDGLRLAQELAHARHRKSWARGMLGQERRLTRRLAPRATAR